MQGWRVLGHALFVLLSIITVTDCLQCYSCKASGNNEMDANIRCLEQAYLENCEDFYNYYNEVEDAPEDLYDSYDYTQYQNPDDEDQSEVEEARDVIKAPASRKVKRAARDKAEDKKVKKEKDVKADPKGEVEYEYEYEYEDEEDATSSPKDGTTGDSSEGGKSQKDEHYCYSVTEKASWESYTVEKGCKKISFCKNAVADKPEWTHPWNFCCDRSRCNAKLVKDKPQRVYGMGCRRTDDCIQGHNGRPICPHFFKSCPRSSYSLVKMECRVKSRTMASVKNVAKYRHQFREKKCYCSKGYFPRGPICTSGATINTSGAAVLLVYFGWFYFYQV